MTNSHGSLCLLAVAIFGCVDVDSPQADGAEAGSSDTAIAASSSSPTDPENPLASELDPQQAQPACDDDGDCCPVGTTPVVGTALANVFNTNAQGLCHVALGGADVINNTSMAGLHAALGGSGADILHGGFGEAILAGGDDNDVLNARGSDDELYGQGGNESSTPGEVTTNCTAGLGTTR